MTRWERVSLIATAAVFGVLTWDAQAIAQSPGFRCRRGKRTGRVGRITRSAHQTAYGLNAVETRCSLVSTNCVRPFGSGWSS